MAKQLKLSNKLQKNTKEKRKLKGTQQRRSSQISIKAIIWKRCLIKKKGPWYEGCHHQTRSQTCYGTPSKLGSCKNRRLSIPRCRFGPRQSPRMPEASLLRRWERSKLAMTPAEATQAECPEGEMGISVHSMGSLVIVCRLRVVVLEN